MVQLAGYQVSTGQAHETAPKPRVHAMFMPVAVLYRCQSLALRFDFVFFFGPSGEPTLSPMKLQVDTLSGHHLSHLGSQDPGTRPGILPIAVCCRI